MDYKIGKKKIKRITKPDSSGGYPYDNENTPLVLSSLSDTSGFQAYSENQSPSNRRIPDENSFFQKNKRRQSTFLQVLDFARLTTNRNRNRILQSFELKDSFVKQKEDFLLWLDNQVQNVESFYNEKEQEYLETFKDIQKQLYVLKLEKKLSSKLVNKHDETITDGEAPIRSSEPRMERDSRMERMIETEGNTRKMKLTPNFRSVSNFGNRINRGQNKNENSNKNHHTENSASVFNTENESSSLFEVPSRADKSDDLQNNIFSDNHTTNFSFKSATMDNRSLYSISESVLSLEPENFPNSLTPTNTVPLRLAKKQLKVAFLEFYRSLELLRSYRLLNRTACQKIIKKFDKNTKSQEKEKFLEKVNNMNFARGEKLDKLLTDIEILYAKYFTKNDRKLAIGYLRSKKISKEHYKPLFLGGLFVGISIPMIIFTITRYPYNDRSAVLMQTWGALFLPVLIALSFTLHFYVFTVFKINYKFIFDFNLANALDYRQYILIPSLFLFMESVLGYFTFDGYMETIRNFFPLLIILMTFIALFLPVSILFRNARCWLGVTLSRLCAPLFLPVGFRDFFIADILCSLTYSFGGIFLYLCYLKNNYGTCSQDLSFIQKMGIISTIPALIRFLQCLRRYIDSKDIHPHLFNALKYLITICYYTVMGFYKSDINNSSYKVGFIFIACLNSIYSSIWDILFDWSLLSWNNTIINGKFRPLGYRNYKNLYYGAALGNCILRFQWICYLLPEPIATAGITGFCVAMMEVLRRFVWIFFRIENEHMSNVEKLRVTKDIKLPYMFEVPGRRLSEDITSLAVHGVEGRAGVQGPVAGEAVGGILEGQPRKRTRGIFDRIAEAISTAHMRDFERPKEDPNSRVLMNDSDSEDDRKDGSGVDSDSEEEGEDGNENENAKERGRHNTSVSDYEEDGDLFEESEAINEMADG